MYIDKYICMYAYNSFQPVLAFSYYLYRLKIDQYFPAWIRAPT